MFKPTLLEQPLFGGTRILALNRCCHQPGPPFHAPSVAPQAFLRSKPGRRSVKHGLDDALVLEELPVGLDVVIFFEAHELAVDSGFSEAMTPGFYWLQESRVHSSRSFQSGKAKAGFQTLELEADKSKAGIQTLSSLILLFKNRPFPALLWDTF